MTPRLTLLSLVSASVIARARAYNVHTVFCAECSDNFDYKSIGVYWSHALSGMPGNVTRLLACDEHQLAHYKGLNLGPTFVHKNHGRITHKRDEAPTPLKYESGNAAPFGSRPSDSSPSYNKPASIMHWALESEEAKYVDYVLYIDADMLLRLPMDPIKMGVKKGVVVSEHVGYLDVGIRNKLAFQFLPEDQAHWAGDDLDKIGFEPEGKKHASAGWYHFFHMDDIRQIAPRWLHYCEQMRLNPQLYWKMMDPNTGRPGGTDHDIVTGDAYVGHGQAPWISEMYGYVFAASEAKLKHILTHGVVVYPDEIGAGQPQEPSIIHYGLHCSVGSFHFTKCERLRANCDGACERLRWSLRATAMELASDCDYDEDCEYCDRERNPRHVRPILHLPGIAADPPSPPRLLCPGTRTATSTPSAAPATSSATLRSPPTSSGSVRRRCSRLTTRCASTTCARPTRVAAAMPRCARSARRGSSPESARAPTRTATASCGVARASVTKTRAS